MSDQEEIKVPSGEEIVKLPQLAKVAFAARCARRVYPLFLLGWPEAREEDKIAVIKAIELAEKYAHHAAIPATDTANDAADAARAAASADTSAYASAAASAATSATLAALAAADAVHAAASAAEAAEAAETANFTTIITNMRMDYNRLKQTAESEKWTDDTLVPPKFFGTLWPDGEPDWEKILAEQKNKEIKDIRKKGRIKKGLSIQAVIPDYISAEQATNALIDLIHSLSEYNIAIGGNGLVIEDFQTFVKEGVYVEVGL